MSKLSTPKQIIQALELLWMSKVAIEDQPEILFGLYDEMGPEHQNEFLMKLKIEGHETP